MLQVEIESFENGVHADFVAVLKAIGQSFFWAEHSNFRVVDVVLNHTCRKCLSGEPGEPPCCPDFSAHRLRRSEEGDVVHVRCERAYRNLAGGRSS